MRTYRVMAPCGRPKRLQEKKMKIGARSRFYKVPAEVARRPPRRPVSEIAEGGGELLSNWLGSVEDPHG